MSAVGNVFLAPCSNQNAADHLQETVVGGVPAAVYKQYTSKDFGDSVSVWGVSPGGKKYTDQMARGDILLFYTGAKRYTLAGRVIGTEENRELAAELWTDYQIGLRDDDELWPHVIYLTDVVAVQIDSTEVHHEHAGHSRGHPQNFMRLNDRGLRNIREKYGSVRSFLGYGVKDVRPDTFEKADSELHEKVKRTPELTEPERQEKTTTRKARSAAFRSGIKELYEYKCAVCGANRMTPSGRPEVEAAHIYPRSENGQDDFRNGLSLCKLHHWAFDNGWLGLRDDLTLLVKHRPQVAGFAEFSSLEGTKLILPPDERYHPAKIYLREHRALHGFDAEL
ncbi:HNH endonuclease [Haloprofundus halophilus]|uniref:HNH endonuclease n=1 Tax=Haloprofundus halophilus TaxID=2283527 RepID=UPI000E453344|nr:HNH endonuclease [Haloprofundus halophilus]